MKYSEIPNEIILIKLLKLKLKISVILNWLYDDTKVSHNLTPLTKAVIDVMIKGLPYT